MASQQTASSHRPAAFLNREQQLRAALLLAFCDPLPPAVFALSSLSSQWNKLLHWLDISGLALCFLERITRLDRLAWLPPTVQARLNRNLADNTQRTHSMLAECIAIQQEFQCARLSHLLLKGFSLAPSSVPRFEVRSQLDLDILIAPDHAGHARRILENRGYRLHAISGRSWEFKTPNIASGSLRDLYKDSLSRCVELHLEAAPGEPGARIANAEHRIIHGFEMAVLAPVDLFLDQAAHLFKHVSTGFFRCSHLLEFYRHVVWQREDESFWTQVNAVAATNRRACLALGVVTLLTERIMGPFAPAALAAYTHSLSPAVRLWVELYGPRCAYADFPGNKLYLLLQGELAGDNPDALSSIERSLLPRRLPLPISHAPANETSFAKGRRHLRQLRYILFRLRFHVVEGLRYAWERRGWRQRICRFVTTEFKPHSGQPRSALENKGMTIP